MIEPVFKKTDFELCAVPVPKGYPQSQTHCGVQLYGNDFFLTTSPFPNPKIPLWKHYFWRVIEVLSLNHIKHRIKPGEDFENPCIYRGVLEPNRRYPRNFVLLNNGPLMDKPYDRYGLGSYCSDPDLYIDNNLFYVLNRTSVRKQNYGTPKERYETKVHLIEGLFNGFSIDIKNITKLFDEQDASPCLTRFDNTYYYFSIDSNSFNTGEKCDALYFRTSNTLKGLWSDKKEIRICSNGYEPWHMSVFQYKEHLYSIIACVKLGEKFRCWQMLGVFSDDLSSVFIYRTPLTDFQSYRGSAVVIDGLFVLYTPTINEKIKGGTSVDGREIMVASMRFEELLTQLKKYESDAE